MIYNPKKFKFDKMFVNLHSTCIHIFWKRCKVNESCNFINMIFAFVCHHCYRLQFLRETRACILQTTVNCITLPVVNDP